jgi:hypothetical protein
MNASASAISPITWAVTTGVPSGSTEVFAAGFAFSRPERPPAPAPGAGLGEADALICGNSPVALPAPMSELPTPFRSGSGPTGIEPVPMLLPAPTESPLMPVFPLLLVLPLLRRGLLDDGPGDDLVGAVTCAVSVAVGGFFSAVPGGCSITFRVTEVTDVALDGTATTTGSMVWFWPGARVPHDAVLFPVTHNVLLNWAISPAGRAASVTVTLLAVGGAQFWLQTWTVNVPEPPRRMLAVGLVTLMQSSGVGLGLLEVGLGLLVGAGLPLVVAFGTIAAERAAVEPALLEDGLGLALDEGVALVDEGAVLPELEPLVVEAGGDVGVVEGVLELWLELAEPDAGVGAEDDDFVTEGDEGCFAVGDGVADDEAPLAVADDEALADA